MEPTKGAQPTPETPHTVTPETLKASEAAPVPAPAEKAPAAAQAAPVATPAMPASPSPAPMSAAPAAVTGPVIADDVDVIEKEWVDKAQGIIDKTKNDPYQEEEQMEGLQVDYLKKRYGKDIGKPSGGA